MNSSYCFSDRVIVWRRILSSRFLPFRSLVRVVLLLFYMSLLRVSLSLLIIRHRSTCLTCSPTSIMFCSTLVRSPLSVPSSAQIRPSRFLSSLSLSRRLFHHSCLLPSDCLCVFFARSQLRRNVFSGFKKSVQCARWTSRKKTL